MATTKSTATANAEERVEVFIPRGQANEDPNFYVSVNDYRATLPRSKKSMVPKFVADEINRSFEAQEALDRRVEEMLEANK